MADSRSQMFIKMHARTAITSDDVEKAMSSSDQILERRDRERGVSLTVKREIRRGSVASTQIWRDDMNAGQIHFFRAITLSFGPIPCGYGSILAKMLGKSHCMSSASESKKGGTILGLASLGLFIGNAKGIGEPFQPYSS